MCCANQDVGRQESGSSRTSWEQADTDGQLAKQAECESQFTPPSLNPTTVPLEGAHVCCSVVRTYSYSTGARTAVKNKKTQSQLYPVSSPPLRSVEEIIPGMRSSSMVQTQKCFVAPAACDTVIARVRSLAYRFGRTCETL